MDIYNEIQNYIHNLSARDYQLLEQMKTKYSDETILNLVKEYPGKPLSYISKIQPRKKDVPEWFDKDIKKELTSKEEVEELIKEWKEFFKNENEYQEWCKKQLERIGE